jgi:small conductance mechanosensitive channel
MEILKDVLGLLKPGIPLVIALVLGALFLAAIRKFLDKRFEGQADRSMKLQLIMLILSLVLLVIIIIVSPINDNQKGQILSLIGIVLSAALALSSTTFVGNAIAGFMLRAVKGFRVGDFISVGDNFGRVSERGLFHVEIQTEQRDLVTLPNLHLITNPVKVIRSSGTIVWTEVSLGYNFPRTKIRDALLKAAEKCELQEPFVHIMQLGDFSVLYRISGLLLEVKQLLSARSKIREHVLDELHAANIEIVSPTFMNTRQLPTDTKVIPTAIREEPEAKAEPTPEETIFDKADEAESLEELRQQIKAMGDEIKALEESKKKAHGDDTKAKIEAQIDRLQKRREAFVAHLEAENEKAKKD